MRVPVDQQKNAVIPVADAPHGDLQVIQGTQARSPAHPTRVTFRLYAGVPAGGIQNYFQKNKCLFRYSRSISNIIPRIINHNKTFISARRCVIAQLRASQRENLRRAA